MRTRFGWTAALLAGAIIGLSGPAQARRESPAPKQESAAGIFERVLAERGLEAAQARLREILADTTDAYALDAFELLRGLPLRLKQQGKKTEALALIETLADAYGDSPRYWPELADAYLQAGDREKARAALQKAVALDSSRADLAWTLSHLEEVMSVIAIQLGAEGKYAAGQNTGLSGPYLGQKPPGTRPEVFAPGIVSTTANEYSITFTPDGREIYFSRGGIGTLVCRWTDEGWTAPQVVYLIDEQHVTEEASVAPDGRRLYFCGRESLRSDREIYLAERAGAGWGTPRKLFPGMYPTATSNGVLYYTATGGRPDYGVLVRRLPVADGFGEPEVLVGGMNSPAPDAHPFIAPDETFLLFDTYRQPGAGIYISFRRDDGSWSEIVSLGDRLGIPPVGQAMLTPDAKYLFFSMCNDMYWVDAGFLEELRSR